ncbi:MAG: hypothetical protein GEU28_11470 [Dehalococcoidia bacterium]|nr:hypothetical protein [Dehalococcoidia bacterium]
MSNEYSVVVERNRLKFAAAHMATYGGALEPLHGHNYALHLEVRGSLAANSWVIDFGVLKRIGRDLCDRLDHRFLLQSASPIISIAETAGEYVVGFDDRRYVFPVSNVAALDIDNTTAERLAEWMSCQVWRELRASGADNIAELLVVVEEAPGQSGSCRTFA